MGTALVTGATAGIGRAFAEELARRGHALVLVARSMPRLEEVADELRSRHGVAVEVLSADLSDEVETRLVAERLADAGRPVDLLVNNAGFGLGQGFVDGDLAAEQRALDVMVRAVMVLSHAAARAMRSRGHGAIVNVSSVSGFVVMSSYSAVKSFVTVFSEALANELRGTGVTATALCPGFTRTEFHGRAGMDMSRLPGPLWLDADRLVRDGLADVARGRVVSVPGPAYKATVLVAKLAPRAVVRRVSGAIGAGRRRG
ncbi:MAG TPA: SDR family oxidoreductase [Segeticoccus sp.]|nr:SDR family oxidoreductase [Segeticoccus sp.]